MSLTLLRNRARMDLLLEVVRLRGLDDEAAYASRIRDHVCQQARSEARIDAGGARRLFALNGP